MRTGYKIILIIVVILVAGMFIALIGMATGQTKGGGPIGLVIGFAMLAGIRAIWKYNADANQNNSGVQKLDDDNQQLDKS